MNQRVEPSLKKPWHRRVAITVVFCLLSSILGCGQTGPLYLPPDDERGGMRTTVAATVTVATVTE